MIAGEEPDLAMRLRKRDWRLLCLPDEMTLHDAAIHQFGQFWRRAKRSGHAYAELAARHGGGGFGDYRRRQRGVLFWGLAPVAGAVLLAVGLMFAHRGLAGRWLVGQWLVGQWLVGLGAGLLVLPFLQLARLTTKGWRSRKLSEAFTIAAFQMAAKPAQALGIARFWQARLAGKRSALIEYKRTAA
jgi:hypothetical protein